MEFGTGMSLIGVALSVGAMVKAYGKGEGLSEEKIRTIFTTLDNHEAAIDRHTNDEDRHWTKREREIHSELIGELRQDVKELLRRSTLTRGNGR